MAQSRCPRDTWAWKLLVWSGVWSCRTRRVDLCPRKDLLGWSQMICALRRRLLIRGIRKYEMNDGEDATTTYR